MMMRMVRVRMFKKVENEVSEQTEHEMNIRKSKHRAKNNETACSC